MTPLLLNDPNVELICRFCLNKDSSDLTSISKSIDVYYRNRAINLEHVIVVSCYTVYDEFCKTKSFFFYKFKTCIGISVSQDELPKWICKECISQLTRSYTFREKCLETVKYLKDILIERVDVCEDKFGKQPGNCSTADSGTEVQSIKEHESTNASKLSLVRERSSNWLSGHFHRINNG